MDTSLDRAAAALTVTKQLIRLVRHTDRLGETGPNRPGRAGQGYHGQLGCRSPRLLLPGEGRLPPLPKRKAGQGILALPASGVAVVTGYSTRQPGAGTLDVGCWSHSVCDGVYSSRRGKDGGGGYCTDQTGRRSSHRLWRCLQARHPVRLRVCCFRLLGWAGCWPSTIWVGIACVLMQQLVFSGVHGWEFEDKDTPQGEIRLLVVMGIRMQGAVELAGAPCR